LIDNFIERGECDFIREFTTPLPVYVIADQLGVPRKDANAFKRWSDSFARRLSQMASAEEQVEDAENIVAFQLYFAKMIDERRKKPCDDIISDLVVTDIEDPDNGAVRPLNMEELQSILQQLMVAGDEITTSAITGGMLARKEMNVAFAAILSRLDNIRLVEEKCDLSYWPNIILRGLKELHIRFDKRAA